jgi:hypothetical protein
MTHDQAAEKTSQGETFGELLRRARKEWEPEFVVEQEEQDHDSDGTGR